jgi:hypothetical protein
MLFASGSSRLSVVVVVIVAFVVCLSEPAHAAEDISKRVEKLVGEPVRVATTDGLGFPKKIVGLRATSQYEADFDQVVEQALRTGAWTLTDGEVQC